MRNWLIGFLVASAFFAGCGYHREGRGVNVPSSVRRVAVPVFRNDTFEAGLEADVTDALRREILIHRFVELSDVGRADAVVVGVLKKFNTKAISFSQSDFASFCCKRIFASYYTDLA